MSHYINFIGIPALAIRQRLWPLPQLGVLEEDRLDLRVMPGDIDLNMHMNNGRYLSIMDYGRTHLLARVRLLDHVIRSRWTPLVGAVWITYRRSLPFFARYRLQTRLVCWDERWFYMEQIFSLRDEMAAVGWVKGVLRGADGVIAPQTVLETVAPGVVSPPMPEAMAAWNAVTREKLQGR